MQITQFIIGIVGAPAYLFISYGQKPILHGESIASAVLESHQQQSGGFWIPNSDASNATILPMNLPQSNQPVEFLIPQIRCVTNSGVTFAITLNVLYLLPLT
jgi:hypothetical protein